MGKIILNLAMSIDGFIASENGGYDWIVGDGSNKLDTVEKWSYERFLSEIDIVVMGRKCYEQNMHNDFKDKKVYVATNRELTNYENIVFIKGDICRIIEDEKVKNNKNIFLFGGGELLDNFIKKDVIDEYIFGIIPKIIGKGRKLFLKDNPVINLHLEKYFIENGVVILKYSKQKMQN